MSALGNLAGAWWRQRSPTRRVAGWLLAVIGPALLTLALLPFRPVLLGGFLFCALLLVIAITVIGGAPPALTAVVLSVLAATFFFASRYRNFANGLHPDLVSVVAFAIAGPAAVIVIGKLAQLAEDQASSHRVEAALRQVATLVARGVPPAEIFSAVAGEARRLFDVYDAAVVRFEPDGGTIAAAVSSQGRASPAGARWEPDDLFATTAVWRSGRPARVDADTWKTASGPGADFLRELGHSSMVASPIIVQGRRWGALVVSTTCRAMAPDAVERLAGFTELVGTAIANAENLAELTASRARVVTTADETRRQIERDLHDGAQQRLVSLALTLGAARTTVPPGLGELGDELASVAEGLNNVMDDLREMARGIHPAILAEGGLGPALKNLARRSTVPVTLDVQAAARLPERVKVAAYYVAAEALTNAAKHASASVIHVSAQAAGDVLHLRVRDDGTGGADLTRGTGLVGLKDRVEALGGTITIHSPPGAGTSLHAELPLAG